jgi:hypothetical protein
MPQIDAIEQATAMITGRPATLTVGGWLVPSWSGRTTLQIRGGRVVESTRRTLSERHRELIIGEVDSAEIAYQGSPTLLLVGIATFWMLGLGLIFILLHFVIRERYLIIRTRSSSVALMIRGDDAPHRQFMNVVLQQAAQTKYPSITFDEP